MSRASEPLANGHDPYFALATPIEGLGQSTFVLPEGTTTIGRSDRSGITLPDTTVSRSHCSVERRGHEVRVFDSGSQNSTWVGSSEADGVVLKDGDVVSMGRLKLIFHDAATARLSSAPAARRPSRSERTGPPVRTSAGRSPAGVRGGRPRGKSRRSAPRSVSTRSGSTTGGAGGLPSPAVASVLLALLIFLGWVVVRVVPPRDRDPISAELALELEQTRVELAAREERVLALRKQIEDERRAGRSVDDALRNLDRVLGEITDLRRQEQRLVKSPSREDSESKVQPLLASRGSRPEPPLVEETDDDWGDSAELRAAWDEELKESDPSSRRTVLGSESGDDGDGSDDQDDRRTEVKKLPAPTMSSAEIRDLAKQLPRLIDEYGIPGSTPEILEPVLTQLSEASGPIACRALFEGCHHSKDLLRQIDKDLAFLDKRVKALLADAASRNPQSEGSGKKEGSSRKKEGSNRKKGGPKKKPIDAEKAQRELELSETAIEIKKDQRAQLVAIRDAILQRVATRTDPASTSVLAQHFISERDRSERLAMLQALGRIRDPATVKIIVRKIRDSDEAVRSAVHATLVKIAGQDLGTTSSAWLSWARSKLND